jgi:hypothetical protein
LSEARDVESSAGAAVIQFVPLFFFSAIYAAIVFAVARKRGVNSWPWVIGTLVPFFGLIVSGVFFLLTLFSILDRLNRLQAQAKVAEFG